MAQNCANVSAWKLDAIYITFETHWKTQNSDTIGPRTTYGVPLDPSWSPESKNVDGKIRNRFCPVLEPVFRSARFALLWLTQGSYRNGRGIHGSGLRWGFQKYPYFPFSVSGLAVNPEKPVFPFWCFVTQPRHLQSWVGYPQIGLDLRIPTVPIFTLFRIRFGRKSGKTVEKRFFRFAVLWLNQGTYRNGRGIPGSIWTWGLRWYP